MSSALADARNKTIVDAIKDNILAYQLNRGISIKMIPDLSRYCIILHRSEEILFYSSSLFKSLKEAEDLLVLDFTNLNLKGVLQL